MKVDLIFPRQSDEARDLAWAAARAKAQELGEDRAFAKVWGPLLMHSRRLQRGGRGQKSLLRIVLWHVLGCARTLAGAMVCQAFS